MIGTLNGRLVFKDPPHLLLEVNGVGYELEVPLSTFERLPDTGASLVLHTHLTVREDAHILFAFGTPAEKNLFRDLIKLNGVGPKLGLAILSGLSVNEFWNVVRSQDAVRLTKLPGVGKKTAERLVLELKDRAENHVTSSTAEAGPSANRNLLEARRALEALGYKPAEAVRMCDEIARADMSTEQLVREALKRVARR